MQLQFPHYQPYWSLWKSRTCTNTSAGVLASRKTWQNWKNGRRIKCSPGLVGDGSEIWLTQFCIRFYRLKQVCQFSLCFVIYNNAFQFTVVFSVLSSIGIFFFLWGLKSKWGPQLCCRFTMGWLYNCTWVDVIRQKINQQGLSQFILYNVSTDGTLHMKCMAVNQINKLL